MARRRLGNRLAFADLVPVWAAGDVEGVEAIVEVGLPIRLVSVGSEMVPRREMTVLMR
jgi:diphthamide synthase (EF-2-diphthine--ammonia ligase)